MIALILACSTASEPLPEEPVGLATELSIEEQRRELVAGLVALAERSAAEGTYDCCTKEPCLHCARMTGHCACAEGLRRGEPVCEECAYHWQRGQGSLEGVEPREVRSFLEAERLRRGEAWCGPVGGQAGE